MQYTQQNYSATEKLFYAWFEAMFTRIDIAIPASILRNDLIEIATELENEVLKFERIANRFDLNSEISWVNKNAIENPIAISEELYNILHDCQLHTLITTGYFDISVYSENRNNPKSDSFILNPFTKTIQLTRQGVLLDVSGFLKGYVLGKLIAIIETKNIDNILINVGNSSIYAKGNHPFGSGWKIKIPSSETECILQNECLTTSGNSDKTVWNIINPLTSKAVENKKPVSVITKLPHAGEVVSKVAYIAPKLIVESILKQYNARMILS